MQLSHSLHNLVQLGLLSVCNVQYMGLENCLIGKDQTLHTGQAKWSAFNFSIIEVHLSKALKKKKWKCPYCMFARKWKNATIQSKSFKKPSNKMEKLNGIFFSTLAECWKIFLSQTGVMGIIWMNLGLVQRQCQEYRRAEGPRVFVSFSLKLLHLLLSSASYQWLGWTKGPSFGAKGKMSCVTLNPPAKPVGHFVSAVRTKQARTLARLFLAERTQTLRN